MLFVIEQIASRGCRGYPLAMARRSSAAALRSPDGSCSICSAWVCQHLVLEEDSQGDLRVLGGELPSNLVVGP
eukprot:14174986-Alexandrium_andersonii.AAC.1